MLQRVDFNPNAYRTATNIDGLSVVSGSGAVRLTEGEHGRNFRDILNDEEYRAKLEAQGIGIADFRLPPPVCDDSAAKALSGLRETFGTRMNDINISTKILSRMKQDEELYQEVVNTLQNILDNIAAFKRNTGGAVAQVHVKIDDNGIFYAYGVRDGTSPAQQSAVKIAWDRMMQVLGTRPGPLLGNVILGRM